MITDRIGLHSVLLPLLRLQATTHNTARKRLPRRGELFTYLFVYFLADICKNYQTLTDATRKYDYVTQDYICQMSSVFITYLFTHLCISFSWCMALAKLPKSDRCRKKTWLRNTKPQMWQHTQWLVSLPRSCGHKNGDHMSTEKQMWCKLPCLVKWWSSYSGWGYSQKKSLH